MILYHNVKRIVIKSISSHSLELFIKDWDGDSTEIMDYVAFCFYYLNCIVKEKYP